MTEPEPVIAAAADGVRFPRIYAAIKWTIIGSLILLAVLAVIFWTLVLGEFSASGFRARNPASSENPAITPECAWPLDVNDHNARAICRMFHNLTPEQRARVLAKRNQKDAAP